nr:MAG TPA: Protein of unknown function (DUF1056) [Crassvirales sp.]
MKTIKLILKTILFWYTAILLVLTIASIDSIVEKGFGHIVAMFIINIGLIILCKLNIKQEDIPIITGTKWIIDKLK